MKTTLLKHIFSHCQVQCQVTLHQVSLDTASQISMDGDLVSLDMAKPSGILCSTNQVCRL